VGTREFQNGFLLDHGSYTVLMVPDHGITYAQGINSTGQIVGHSQELGASVGLFCLSLAGGVAIWRCT
jgi:hypothetical protein